MIYFSSDLHLCHDKEFIYKARGFDNIDQMNESIIKNFNSIINEDDDLYLLGDLFLSNFDKGIELLKQLKGRIHIILGNHDSNSKIKQYRKLDRVVDISYANLFKFKDYKFFLCHYPCMTSNHQGNSETVYCIHGHTHSKDKFEFEDSYNVAVDAHNCYPVKIDQIISDLDKKKSVISNA